MKTFYWLVKREFWEHKGGFLWAPVITGSIFLLLTIMTIITVEVLGAQHGINFGAGGNLRHVIDNMDAGDMSHVGEFLDVSMYVSMGLITTVLGFVIFFYCLGSLYDDRRDRSILFWKSLPISDTGTVLAKLVSATLLAPLIAMVVGIVVGILQLLILAIVLSFHGINVWQLLILAHPFRVLANLVGHLPIYLLWALPSAGWLMLCSAWARSKPFLWAIALPVISGVLVWWFDVMGLFHLSAGWFWGNVVGRGLLGVFPLTHFALTANDFMENHGGEPSLDIMNLSQTYSTLALPQMWIGIIVGVGLIAAAIWFRRWRDDS